MKKSGILIAVCAILAAISCAKAEGGTVGNLSAANSKISSIDINKHFAETGSILDSFFSGAAIKKGSSASVVYMENAEKRTPAQAQKEVCNAKPAKIGKLAAKVPALAPASGRSTDTKHTPSPSGKGASEIAVTSLLDQKKSWSDDLDTVVEYVKDEIKDRVETQKPESAVADRG